LKIFYANCKSLENKYNELNLILLHEKYDIFTGTETWFDSSIPLSRINNNYNVFRRDRNRNGGGIIAAIDEKYKCMRRVDLESNILETLWIEIFLKPKNLLLAVFYLPPILIINDFRVVKEEINSCLDNIFNSNRSYHMLITGDFNIDYSETQSKNTVELNDLMLFHSLSQTVKTPTYPVNRNCKQSIIDLVFTNDKSLISEIKVKDNLTAN
jgi:exonuclease III